MMTSDPTLQTPAVPAGQAADLRALARVLKGGDTAAIGQIAVASGMGGIGR